MPSKKKAAPSKPKNGNPLDDPWGVLRIWVRHAGRYPCDPSWYIEPNVSKHYCFFYIEKGEGTVIRDDDSLEALPGDLFIMQPGHTYEALHNPQKPVTVLSIGFTIRGAGNLDLLLRYPLPDRIRLAPHQRKHLTQKYESVIAIFYQKSTLSKLAMRGALLNFVAFALKLNEETPERQKTGTVARSRHLDERAENARRFIDNNLSRSLSLHTIAKAAHLSPVYFANLFRRELGQSPMAYVRHRRIDVARAFLASSTVAIAEIARKVGYDDPFHFSRVFNRLEGCSPTEFRESCKDPFKRRGGR